MKTNDAGVTLIKKFEGCRLAAYKDGGGVLTIGYGHIAGVCSLDTITQAEAEALLAADIASTEAGVAGLLKVKVTDNQFAALVSFAFNVGVGSLKTSLLLRCLNKLHPNDAANQFARWCHDDGVEVPGLVARRKAERDLFLS
jgi:lysozyme